MPKYETVDDVWAAWDRAGFEHATLKMRHMLAPAAKEVIQGTLTLSALHEKWAYMRDAVQEMASARPWKRRSGHVEHRTPADEGRKTLTRIQMLHAERGRPDDAAGVQAFRAEYLPTGLLDPGTENDWIAAKQREWQASRERGAAGTEPLPIIEAAERLFPPRAFNDVTGSYIGHADSFVLPEGTLAPDAPARIPLDENASPVIHDLCHVRQRLMDSYGWRQDDATTFILTGAEPDVPLARTRLRFTEDTPGGAYIEMRVSPQASWEDVSALYQKARAELLPEGTKKVRNRKVTNEKQAALAEYVYARHALGASWPDVLSGWNETYRAWQYDADTRQRYTFRRDAKDAFRRVTGVDLPAFPND